MQDRKEDFVCEFCTKVHPDKTLAATLEGLVTSRTCRRKKTRHPLGVETEETNKTHRLVETSLRDSRGAEVLKVDIGGLVRPD
jgi:hypothetical protein